MAQHILQMQRRMQDTWSNHMQVQRGNPVRTYSGKDFKRIIRINPLKTKAIPEK